MGKILSIEVDNRNIKILEGTKKGSSLILHQSIFLDMDPSIIDDGKIIDMDSIAEIIQVNLSQNKISSKKAIITINTNSIITRIIELPLLKKKSDTFSMIKNEIEQLISVDLNQYKLIYKKTETIVSEEGELGKYLVYGLPVSMYDQYLELAQRLKLDLIALDLSFNSLDKITEQKLTINKKALDKNTASVFISFGYDTITFSVVNNGTNEFSRTLATGIKDMVRNFAAAFNIGHEEALSEINKLSLEESYDDFANVSMLNIAEDFINGWTDEFNRYIRYYNSTNKDKNQISKIYIYGTSINMKGLEDYLSSHLSLDVDTIREISSVSVKHSKNKADIDVKVYFNTILSLYIDRKSINFLTDKKKKHKSRFYIGILIMVLSLAVILRGALFLYSYFYNQSALEKEIASIDEFIGKEENIKLNDQAENTKKTVALLEKYKKEIDKVKTAISNEDAVTTIMFEEVGKATPLGTRVNSMSIDKAAIQLQCSSNSKLEIAQFEKNLKNIEFIDYVYIPAVVEGAETGSISYTYTVVCEIKDVISNEAQ